MSSKHNASVNFDDCQEKALFSLRKMEKYSKTR